MEYIHGQPKCDKNKVIEDFKVNLSYSVTGRMNDVSRQRVEQIIKKSKIGILPKQAHLQWIGKKCPECHRNFGDKVGYGADGLCKACYSWKGNIPKFGRRLYRNINYPKSCIRCDHAFTKEFRPVSKGLCRYCYNRTPERRAQMRDYTRRYYRTPKGRAKVLEHSHRYYIEHKKIKTL